VWAPRVGARRQGAARPPTAGDPITGRLAVDQPLQVSVFEGDGGPLGSVGGKADLDLAGVGGVGVVLPLAVDLPGDDQPMGWFPGQHPAPVTLAAVGALLVPAAALAGFQDGGGHVGLADVVLGWPPAAEGVGEGAEHPVDGRVDGDGAGEWWDGGGGGHWSSCSGSVGAAWAALPKAVRASAQTRSR